jgi:hypothetical protein
MSAQVCNLSWSRNVNEVVSTHGYSQNQARLDTAQCCAAPQTQHVPANIVLQRTASCSSSHRNFTSCASIYCNGCTRQTTGHPGCRCACGGGRGCPSWRR